MSYFAVEYAYDPTRAADMDAIRPDHRACLGKLHEAGTLRLVGSWPGDAPGAFLVFEADSAEAALAALDEDPFRKAGLIKSRTAHPYNVVYGEIA